MQLCPPSTHTHNPATPASSLPCRAHPTPRPPQIETVATTLALAEQNNARELKRVCLEFVSKHLQAVMASEGYQYMVQTCPQLQAELLQVGGGDWAFFFCFFLWGGGGAGAARGGAEGGGVSVTV